MDQREVLKVGFVTVLGTGGAAMIAGVVNEAIVLLLIGAAFAVIGLFGLVYLFLKAQTKESAVDDKPKKLPLGSTGVHIGPGARGTQVRGNQIHNFDTGVSDAGENSDIYNNEIKRSSPQPQHAPERRRR